MSLGDLVLLSLGGVALLTSAVLLVLIHRQTNELEEILANLDR